jgi:hypothetical protein
MKVRKIAWGARRMIRSSPGASRPSENTSRRKRHHRTSDTGRSDGRPPLGVPCAQCHVFIPPGERDVVVTKAGLMHSRCFNAQPVVGKFRAIVEGVVGSAVEHYFDGPDKRELEMLLDAFKLRVGTNGQAKRAVSMIVRKLEFMQYLAAETRKKPVAAAFREAIQSLRSAAIEFLPCSPETALKPPKLRLGVGRVPFVRQHTPAVPYY